MLKIYPYVNGSKGAKELAQRLGIKMMIRGGRLERLLTAGRTRFHTIINWGNGRLPVFRNVRIINDPVAVSTASNKLSFFQRVGNGSRVVPWTRDKQVADRWLAEGKKVVARATVTGHSGVGITIHERGPLPTVPLYTQYIPKDDEYRVHCYKKNGVVNVLCTQRKARKLDVPDGRVNWQVRNLAGGFIYVRNNVNPPADVLTQAKLAMGASGLDFGAVDVLYNNRRGQAYILECNTAPGLSGTTVEDYRRMIQELIR